MTNYRIWAQDALTREFYESAVPLIDVEVMHTRNGPGEISGTFDPEIPRVSLPTFDAWRTLLHVEYGDEIRATGLITPYSMDEVALNIVAPGFSDYANGLPFRGDYTAVQEDPLNIVRMLWNSLQNQANGDLGVTLDPNHTTYRVGDRPEEDINEAAKLILDQLNSGGHLFEDFTYPGAPAVVTESNDTLADEFYKDHSFSRSEVTTWLEEITSENGQIPQGDGPYTLSWWENTDIGREISNLASESGFEYREESSWNADKTDIDLHIKLGWPRIGARKDNLRFAEHENIISAVPVTEISDLYASDVVVLGAGEGRERVQGWAEQLGDRLRRVAVIEDKSITTRRRAKQRARDELARRQNLYSFEEIEVDLTHPNSRLGSFAVGDDVPVTGDFPWIGRHTIYHRITQFSYPLDSNRGTLRLKPTNTIRYPS